MIEVFHAAVDLYAAHTGSTPEVVRYLADDGTGGTGTVGTKGLQGWLKDNGVATVLALVSLVIGLGALKRDASKVITIGALACVMLLFVGIAQSSAAQQSVSTTMLGWFGLA